MPVPFEFSRNPAPSVATPTTPTTPPNLQSEVTFISGVAADATIAATSFGAWAAFEPYPSIPAQYNPYDSTAAKWGDPVLQPAGAPGGDVTFAFGPGWDADDQKAWGAALALWSSEVAITFTPVTDGAIPDLTFSRQDKAGTFASFPESLGSVVGSHVEASPGSGAFVMFGTDTEPLGDSFAASNDFYFALIHELGHAIGLGHGGPYNADDVKPFDAAVRQFSPYDMSLWAMMSYITPSMTNATFYADYPVTGTNWGSVIHPITR